jgi:hypothetical protein
MLRHRQLGGYLFHFQIVYCTVSLGDLAADSHHDGPMEAAMP